MLQSRVAKRDGGKGNLSERVQCFSVWTSVVSSMLSDHPMRKCERKRNQTNFPFSNLTSCTTMAYESFLSLTRSSQRGSISVVATRNSAWRCSSVSGWLNVCWFRVKYAKALSQIWLLSNKDATL